MKITPNRAALKYTADFNIDANFTQQFANQVFSFNGDVTPEYELLCAELSKVIASAQEDLSNLAKAIPVVK